VISCNTFLALIFPFCPKSNRKGAAMGMSIQPIDVVILPDGRMDRKNAARYLGLSVKTLAMHGSRGTGPKFIKRGRVFYFREDLDQWLRDDTPEDDAPESRAPRA
jgi:hypothetical protein